MISNFKLFLYFNISQNFVQNVQKQKKTSVLSCIQSFIEVLLGIQINNISLLNRHSFYKHQNSLLKNKVSLVWFSTFPLY